MRTPGLLFFYLFLSFSAGSQIPTPSEAAQKFIHHVDPIGLVIIEKVEPGNTLYGLSKKYNVSIDSILEANPDLNPGSIPLGYPVNIPIYPKAFVFAPPSGPEDGIPVFYRIQPKETLYRISKVYLGTSPETIISLNPRVSEQMSIRLRVKSSANKRVWPFGNRAVNNPTIMSSTPPLKWDPTWK